MGLVLVARARSRRRVAERKGSPLAPGAAARLVALRNVLAFRRYWMAFTTGFLEPVFYLFSIGIGVGALVSGFEVGGREIEYAAFVAPAMLATSAMNGAMYDASQNFFHKLRFGKLYDQMLATPLGVIDVARGELLWSLTRGGVYAVVFWLVMVAMGLVDSWWGLLAPAAALLIGWAFGGICMAITTWVRSWQDFEYLMTATVPMFLFSATFFPLSTFPTWLGWIIEFTPLYRGVVLVRELCTGLVTWGAVFSVVYLLALGLLGLAIVRRRLERLLLS